MKKIRKTSSAPTASTASATPATAMEGEGSYTAGLAYDTAATKYTAAGHPRPAAAAASKALDAPEGDTLRAAERAAKAGPPERKSK